MAHSLQTGHIFLTGFMASGKTTLGRQLAVSLSRPFIDLDEEITRQHGTIADIFRNGGESAFRKAEHEALNIAIAKPPSVIALGGGTVCFENNLPLLKDAGTLVFLETPAEILALRLENSTVVRPLIEGRRGQSLLDFVKETLDSRTPYYSKADLTVNAVNLSADALRSLLMAHLRDTAA